MEKHYSAGGIVIRGDKEKYEVLLIKDSYGRWTWPKGHLEKDEKPERAALREIEEECGLKITKIIKPLGKQTYYFKIEGKRIFKTVFLFLVTAKGREKLIAQKSEIKDAKWFSPDEAVHKIEYKGSKSMLKNGIKEWLAQNG